MKKKLTILFLLVVRFIPLTPDFNPASLKIMIRIIFSCFLILVSVSCVDLYSPDLGEKYVKALVVDGTITNYPGPYTVALSISSPVTDPKLVYYPGCEVTIVCDDGTSETLLEINEGIYQTSPLGIRGEIGKKYKIRIVTPEDKIYESAFEELREPVQIESVYAEIEYKHKEGLYHDLRGYQFYIDTKPAVNDTTYLLWILESTYEYNSSFKCYYFFDDGKLSPFPRFDSIYTCWRTYVIPTLYTFETSGLSTPVIKRLPLNYVTTEDRKLSIKYSLLARQYTVSKKAYFFWNSLRMQNEDQGSLFTTLPFHIRGNVVNINDPNELVLGYFLVAGNAQQRIFKERPPLKFYYTNCELTDNDVENAAWVRYTPEVDWPVYLTKRGSSLALPGQPCIDCRKKGGTVIKPYFWEDK